MSKTVKEWMDDFKTLDKFQQMKIVAGLVALAEWPMFKEVWKEQGLFGLAGGFYLIAQEESMPEHILDLFLR